MSESKSNFNKFKMFLNYVGKIISSAFLVILVLIGIFFVYYVISSRKVAKDPFYTPKINLYTIVSGSMEPAIKVYDVIIDYHVDSPDDIKVGDVISFVSTSSISQGLIVTHRVQEIIKNGDSYQYITKGDFNAVADSSPAEFDNIIGKVVFKIPQLGRIQFFVASKMGWFLIVLLPAVGVIAYDVLKLLRLLNTKDVSSKIKDNKDINSSGDLVIDNVLSNISKSGVISDLNNEDIIDFNNDVTYDVNNDNNNEIVVEYFDLPVLEEPVLSNDVSLNKDDFLKRLDDLKNLKK